MNPLAANLNACPDVDVDIDEAPIPPPGTGPGGGGDALACKPGEEFGEDPDEVFEANVADNPSDIEPDPLVP